MVDDALGNRHAQLAGNRRQEPVHLAVQPQRLDDLRAKHLQRAAVVVQLHARRPRDDPVRHHRRQPARQERVLPVLPPAADDVGALLDQLDQRRDVRGVVLQVAVRRHDQRPARVRKPGGERRRLTEIPPEPDHPHARVRAWRSASSAKAVVRAAVVDRDDLVGPAPALQRVGELAGTAPGCWPTHS